ncbi:hypothetical protein NDU88_001495 [Pleurodeles waltl]|uniref:Uncharacterized protein n=1 Tax=Pleurodeles waltl TaxID=8319 RepID=A0AAV7W178_PLEWA|nr:hypothetical protein NDU88_001495 [Pleurodeles waltl]
MGGWALQRQQRALRNPVDRAATAWVQRERNTAVTPEELRCLGSHGGEGECGWPRWMACEWAWPDADQISSQLSHAEEVQSAVTCQRSRGQ